MNEPGGGLHTRRKFLGLAIGLLTTGCASAVAPDSGAHAASSCPGAGNTKFPEGDQWGWDPAWTTQLDKLGQIIMAASNPYCVLPGSTTTSCTPTNPATWPQQLTNENVWKVLTDFDFFGTSWAFMTTPNVPIQRSMRIPYLIMHQKAKHGPGKPTFARESLLVGYGDDASVNISGALAWDGPTGCSSGQVASVGLLAQFITLNMMSNTDTAGFRVPNWDGFIPTNTDGRKGVPWTFRQATIQVDYPFRFPVAVGQGAAQRGGWIYVGYEGGGAY